MWEPFHFGVTWAGEEHGNLPCTCNHQSRVWPRLTSQMALGQPNFVYPVISILNIPWGKKDLDSSPLWQNNFKEIIISKKTSFISLFGGIVNFPRAFQFQERNSLVLSSTIIIYSSLGEWETSQKNWLHRLTRLLQKMIVHDLHCIDLCVLLRDSVVILTLIFVFLHYCTMHSSSQH